MVRILDSYKFTKPIHIFVCLYASYADCLNLGVYGTQQNWNNQALMSNAQHDGSLQPKTTSDYSSQGFTRNSSFTLYKPSSDSKKGLSATKTKKFSIFKTQNSYMKKMNTSMTKSTVPHASIDLMVNNDAQKMMIKQEQSNDDTVGNIDSSSPK